MSSNRRSRVVSWTIANLVGLLMVEQGGTAQDLHVPSGDVHIGEEISSTWGHLNVWGSPYPNQTDGTGAAKVNIVDPTGSVWLGLEAFRNTSTGSELALLSFASNSGYELFGMFDGKLGPGGPFWIDDGASPGLRTAGSSLKFLVDGDDDSSLAFDKHEFVWYLDSTAAGKKMMVLERVGFNSAADLFVDGNVTANGFDLAEGFWMSEPVAPGDVVALDPARPGAVRKAAGPGDPLLLGVVSGDPALVMGGRTLSVERLRALWGDEAGERFDAERDELEQQAYEAIESLANEWERLATEASFRSSVSESRVSKGPGSVSEPRPGEAASLARRYREEVQAHRSRLEDETLRRFFERRVAAVALAGRVSVAVDAAFGAISPGDPLTASPIPGVAMRASEPGPVLGVALEGLAAGSGAVLALVDREWYPGDRDLGQRSPAADRLALLERELADRERRLARLEGRLTALESERGTSGIRRAGNAAD